MTVAVAVAKMMKDHRKLNIAKQMKIQSKFLFVFELNLNFFPEIYLIDVRHDLHRFRDDAVHRVFLIDVELLGRSWEFE